MKLKFLLLAGLLLLSACAGVSYYDRAPDKKSWKSSLKQVRHLTSWEIRGKLSLRQENQFVSFDIFWQQKNNDQVIRLVAPLGQGTTELRGSTENGYTVLTNEGERLQVDSPESVSLHAFGIELPFSDIQFWIKGIPAPVGEVWRADFNQTNQLTHFQQNGWDVSLKKYQAYDAYNLPVKVFIHKLTETNAQFSEKTDVRIIIRRWMVQD